MASGDDRQCATCKHWNSDYGFPFGHCQLTWTDLTPDDPRRAWEAKYPESHAVCDMFDFGKPCEEQRALLQTNGLKFSCSQWQEADAHALAWLQGKLAEYVDKERQHDSTSDCR